MSSFLVRAALAAAFAGLSAAPVSAHVTLETRQAAVGGYYKAVLAVPHGCAGSPTVKLRVRIPEGVIAVKPQPKAGWALQTIKGDYARSYTLHGAASASGVQEIVWSGKLPDDNFDEFVFHAYLAPTLQAGQTLYFPVVQECEKGVARWIDTPASGGADAPAPSLKLLPKP